MKAIEIMQQYWEQFKQLLVYIQFCTENEIQTPVCRDFWTWTMYASLGLALLIAVILGKIIFKEQLELYRNKKKLEARKIVADQETMDQARWKGEEAADVDLSQEELAERMREAMKVRAELTMEVQQELADASVKKNN